ncbi:MAG: sulfatase, partial [Chthoniobacteraceae bacterium]
PEPGAGSAGGFRGAKATLYEGGVRSPLVVWAPGLMAAEKAGYHNEGSVFSAIDLVPSLLAITGVPGPEGIGFDGENIAGTLLGKADDSRKAPIFWRRPPDRKTSRDGMLPDLAMREGNWKLLCNYDGSTSELYDLAKDRAETTNVSGANPEIVRDLTAKLLAWHQSMPPDNGPSFSEQAEKTKRQRRPGN